MNKKFKIMLTFDVDAETLWTAPDATDGPVNHLRPTLMSQASYGPLVAIPRILRIFDDYEIKGTFFIPGATVEKYPDMVTEINRRGHEIGNHGYTHITPDAFKCKEDEVKEYEDASAAVERIIKQRPRGFRAPSWEFSTNTLGILKEMGFTYDSSQMASDKIGWLEAFGEKTGIPEIPINWSLDDAPLWMLSITEWGAPMPSPNAVYESWSEAFQYLYEEDFDNVFVLTCHPQIIGRPERIRMYEKLVRFLKGHRDVEFMRCIDAAEQFLSK